MGEQAEARVAQERTKLHEVLDAANKNAALAESQALHRAEQIELDHRSQLEEAATKLAAQLKQRLEAEAKCADQAQLIVSLEEEVAALREQLRVSTTPVITNKKMPGSELKKMGPK